MCILKNFLLQSFHLRNCCLLAGEQFSEAIDGDTVLSEELEDALGVVSVPCRIPSREERLDAPLNVL